MPNKNVAQLINDYLQYAEVEKNLSQGTIKMYHIYLNTFLNFAKKDLKKTTILPKDLTKDLITNYRVYLNRKVVDSETNKTLSKATQNCFLISLRSFLRFLSVQKDIKALDANKIVLSKTSDRLPKFLSVEEIERLFSMQNVGKRSGVRDRSILELLYSTGLRVSELTNLNVNNITAEVLQSGEFSVIGKGRKARTVFLNNAATYWLKRYLSLRKDNFKPLFIRYSGKSVESNDKTGEGLRLTPRSVQRMVKKYALKAGIAKTVTPHVLRHSFATHILKKGGDIRSVQELLGHSNISTTQIYTHLTNKDLKKTHSKFHNRGAPSEQTSEVVKKQTGSII